MDFKTMGSCSSDSIREKASHEADLLQAKQKTGEDDPCSGCGEDHDAYECWNNGNRPMESDEPADHQYKLENVYKGFQDSLDKLKALGV